MDYTNLDDEDEFCSRSFGWDLAGYGNSYSALCYAEQNEEHKKANLIHVTILDCNAICRPGLAMPDDLRQTVHDERQMLEHCCSIAPVVIDVPIDLSPLPEITQRNITCDVRYYWQLVKRPVDQALRALPPLADRIGYAVARLANLLQTVRPDSNIELGRTLFETYPAASLDRIHQTRQDLNRATNQQSQAAEVIQPAGMPPYKGGRARFDGDRWLAKGQRLQDQSLADLMNDLSFRAGANEAYNADDFDAVICAAVECFPEPNFRMTQDALRAEVRADLAEMAAGEIQDACLLPSGYRILHKWPEGVSVLLHRRTFEDAHALHDFLSAL